MATLSIRLPDDLMHEVDVCAAGIHISRASYVRKALERMNVAGHARRCRTRLMKVSLRVRGKSMRVNAEFDETEDAPHV